MGILFFTYKICYSHAHKNYSHSHSQLVAQNYSRPNGNPMGMGIRIPMHTSTIVLFIGSRIRAFDLYQNQWPWMTLNGETTAYARYLRGDWASCCDLL